VFVAARLVHVTSLLPVQQPWNPLLKYLRIIQLLHVTPWKPSYLLSCSFSSTAHSVNAMSLRTFDIYLLTYCCGCQWKRQLEACRPPNLSFFPAKLSCYLLDCIQTATYTREFLVRGTHLRRRRTRIVVSLAMEGSLLLQKRGIGNAIGTDLYATSHRMETFFFCASGNGRLAEV